ncbi:MAG: TIGR02996 domain-containing protein [Myxococcales bacterium]|nr:TIGR02996 domain-containing protein [Myxococcales bacterium]
MDVADRLLDAVLQDPAADAPRLILADWYEDSGDTDRATLIRAQVTAAALPAWHADVPALRWRAEQLLAMNGRAWRAALPSFDGLEWGDFERGMPTTVVVRDIEALFRHADALAACAPVDTVEIVSEPVSSEPYGLAPIPWVRRVRLAGSRSDLRNRWATIHDQDLAWLEVLVQHAETVEMVHLEAEDDFPERLLQRTPLSRAREVRVTGNHTVGRPFAQLIARTRGPIEPWPGQPEDTTPPPVHTLHLGTDFVDYDSGYFEDPTLGSGGVEILAGSHLTSVSKLNLDLQRLGPTGLHQVRRSFTQLTELSARSVGATSEWMDPMPAGPPMKALTLRENALTDAGLLSLLPDPKLAELCTLDLDTCELTAEGVAALASSPLWSSLRVLRLGNNTLTGLGDALATAPAPPHLHTLDLHNADLSPGDLRALADKRWFRSLQVLDLSDNPVGTALGGLAGPADRSWVAIRMRGVGMDRSTLVTLAPRLRECVMLDLSENAGSRPEDPELGIGSIGTVLRHLLDEDCPRLQGLWLDDVGAIQTAGLEHASAPHLHRLSLMAVPLDAHTLQALLELPMLAGVTDLDLRSCSLTDEALQPLCRWPGLAQLDTLLLSSNDDVSPAGLLQLANALPFPPRLFRGPGRPWGMDQELRDRADERLGPHWFHRVEERPHPWMP